MTRRRTLRPEEEDLWRTVARTARPLHDHPMFHPQPEPTPVFTPPEPGPAKPPVAPFRLGERAQVLKGTALPHALAVPSLRMDAGLHGKLKRGKLAPEARIDLHGLTLAEAHPDLVRFILNAHSAGLRLVLVITGKGKPRDDPGPIPRRTGALRQQVPQWLRQPPLSAVVQEITEAHLRHGGSGALYVYLRRS